MSLNKFSDLNIATPLPGFTGDKVKIARVLNTEITVHDYRIEPSKYPEKGNGKCLYLQIGIKGEKRVLFTGSVALQNVMQAIPRDKFPFTTTIIKEDDQQFKLT